MGRQKWTGTDIGSLMDSLKGKDGAARQKAREALVEMGKPAVLPLSRALQETKLDQVRWEAAKALGDIGDAGAIAPLVKVLGGSDADVAWLAAEGLKKFKKAAWPALLRELVKNGEDSVLLRQGAHHVLLNQKEHGFNDLLATLTKALESITVPGLAAASARDILKRMKEK